MFVRAIPAKGTAMLTCFECDAPADHDHHVIPRSQGGRRTIPLCAVCHGKVHSTALTSIIALAKAAAARKRALGERWGSIPYGKQDIDGKLVDHPVEAPIAKRICKMRGAGMSLRKIARVLTEEGIYTRSGRDFTAEQVRRITV